MNSFFVAILKKYLVITCLAFLGFNLGCKSSKNAIEAAVQILPVQQMAQTQINNRMDLLHQQVSAFSTVLAKDRDFSIKLFAESDKTAPEVTEMASRYMEPMGLSLFMITSAKDTLLSCGQFPASIGSFCLSSQTLGQTPCFIYEELQGKQIPALEIKTKLTILDSSVQVIGGLIVDESFLKSIFLPQGYNLICKQGPFVMGMSGITTITDLANNIIFINGNRYAAASIAVPFCGQGSALQFIVIDNTPLP
jgi:hypothetical protein